MSDGGDKQDAQEETTGKGPALTDGGVAPNNVRLDSSSLKSTYCNVCNATSTREEVVLNFGLNQNWDLQNSEFSVALHHRIILSPHAAKRLHTILSSLLEQHEKRYGELS